MNINDIEVALDRLRDLEDPERHSDFSDGQRAFVESNIKPAQESLEELLKFLKRLGSTETMERLFETEE